MPPSDASPAAVGRHPPSRYHDPELAATTASLHRTSRHHPSPTAVAAPLPIGLSLYLLPPCCCLRFLCRSMLPTTISLSAGSCSSFPFSSPHWPYPLLHHRLPSLATEPLPVVSSLPPHLHPQPCRHPSEHSPPLLLHPCRLPWLLQRSSPLFLHQPPLSPCPSPPSSQHRSTITGYPKPPASPRATLLSFKLPAATHPPDPLPSSSSASMPIAAALLPSHRRCPPSMGAAPRSSPTIDARCLMSPEPSLDSMPIDRSSFLSGPTTKAGHPPLYSFP